MTQHDDELEKAAEKYFWEHTKLHDASRDMLWLKDVVISIYFDAAKPWKDEYENLCKFATDYENRCVGLVAENARLRSALEVIYSEIEKEYAPAGWDLLSTKASSAVARAKEALESSDPAPLNAIREAMATLEVYASKSNWYERTKNGRIEFHDGSDSNNGFDFAEDALANLKRAFQELERII